MSGAASSARAQAAPVLSLFRQILRLHRDKLPPPMRAMGDTYVKDEFAKHLQGKTSEAQWAVFMQEWQRYHAMLSGAADLLQDPAAAAAQAAAAEAAERAAAQAAAGGGGGCGCGGGGGGGGSCGSSAAAAAEPAAEAEAEPAGPATTTISAAASGSCGEMSEGVLGMLSPDQLARLELLRQRANQYGRQLLTPEEGGGEKAGGGGAAQQP